MKKVLTTIIISLLLITTPTKAGVIVNRYTESVAIVAGLSTVALIYYFSKHPDELIKIKESEPEKFNDFKNEIDTFVPKNEEEKQKTSYLKNIISDIIHGNYRPNGSNHNKLPTGTPAFERFKGKASDFIHKHPKIENIADKFKHKEKDNDYKKENTYITPVPEQPKAEDSYLQSSAQLTRSMEKAGMKKPENTAAHHIIPEKDIEAQDARDILAQEDVDIDINGAENGVYLPTPKNDGSVSGIIHSGRHPKNYAIKVNKRIEDAYELGGKKEVQEELKRIKSELKQANSNDPWNGVIK